MSRKGRQNLFSALVAMIVFGFTVFAGTRIAGMTGHKDPVTPTAPPETSSEAPSGSTEAPSIIPPGESTEEPSSPSDPSSEEPTLPTEPTGPAPTDPTAPAADIRALSDGELQQISASYDGTPRNFYAGGNVDENNRSLLALNFESELRAKFGNVRIFNGQNGESCSLTFLLTLEYENRTNQILDYLANYGAKATFFVTQSYAASYPDIIQRLIREGHEIGSLGARFPEGGVPSEPLAAQMENVYTMHTYMRNTYGYEMHKFYFCYEMFSDQSLAMLEKMGYTAVFFSANYMDYSPTEAINPDTFLIDYQNRLCPGMVYSLHTVNPASVIIMPGLLSYIRQDRGYTIDLIP